MAVIKFKIICLGKLKEKAYLDLQSEFLKRLSPFAKVSVVELAEESYSKKDDIERIKFKEAQKIKQQIPANTIVVLLEERGKQKSSIEFAKQIDRLSSLGQELVFILGSGVGLHDSLKDVANYSISLSPLTFPHNLARILILEQMYRACSINSGKLYHKE